MTHQKNHTQYTPSIIPLPVKLTPETGQFAFNHETIIECDPELKKIGEFLQNFLYPATTFEFNVKIIPPNHFNTNSIVLKLDNGLSHLGLEGYSIKITRENVIISALTSIGIFYGIQSLRQLLPPEIDHSNEVKNVNWGVSCVQIEDYPRFPWRGFMLDDARHFLGKEIVLKILDLLALLKMNVFHWHLTDDQGWRIEIKKYPKLTEIGSKRTSSQIGGFISKNQDGIPHQGYYTQDDIKEIVTYAANRGINIIPEIEMPGHCIAALSAYPEMSCSGGPFDVSSIVGIHKDVFCVGKEHVFTFLQNILKEIMTLFPSEIIHIGGDEVPKTRWKQCPDCQARIKMEGFEDEKDLQYYFTNRIVTFLALHGKRTMGWNQILNDTLPIDVISQYWMFDKKKVINHLKRGRKIVMSKYGRVYLDYGYAFTPLKKTYAYDPIPKKLAPQFHQNVLGIEAPLWTEWVRNAHNLYWQIFPRLFAVAETGWTQKILKSYTSFTSRLHTLSKRLDCLGINYAREKETNPTFLKRLFGIFTILVEPKRPTRNASIES
ncbi:MAG: beta-N-acetylglucosaminidase [Candidatus Lokiarchaeota archaeon]|nr:beta-N-acetylglucosaminidase [Candidatus Lokiarchaeota archaeon]